MTYTEKLQNLRNIFDSYGIDACVVPSTDEFHNEYVPQYLNRLQWLTGFTGSNGVAIITKTHAALYTDSRYIVQAKQQLQAEYKVFDINSPKSKQWLQKHLPHNITLGLDPMLHSEKEVGYYQTCSNATLIFLSSNPIDALWKREYKYRQVCEHLPINITGETHRQKLFKVIESFKEDADYLLITNPDSICWLLNIRGSDIDFTPLLLSYLMISRRGELHLFTELPHSEFKELNLAIEIYKLAEVKSVYNKFHRLNYKIRLDPAKTPYWFVLSGNHIVRKQDPCAALKVSKNALELQGMEQAHVDDGIAMCKFLYWLENNLSDVTEIQAADYLLELRKKSRHFRYPSFATISAYGSNGAIVHYHPTEQTNRIIGTDSLYLVDSGGQYSLGTTDVTRTLHFGTPTPKQKLHYTLVLKGMIQLTNTIFPDRTIGAQLDSLARHSLWQHGLDYGHGTGHGVGHFLSVHEGPINISKRNNIPISANMILSNEPGYYKEGDYGIRIENVLRTCIASVDNFLKFETLTLVPISTKLTNCEMLNRSEKEWLKQYHEKILTKLGYHLTVDEKLYIKQHITVA